MSQYSNILTSLLMSLPLVAVPCLAIFGIPTSDASSDTQVSEGIDLGDPSGVGDSSLGTASLGEASIEFQGRSEHAGCDHENCDHEHSQAAETSFETGGHNHEHDTGEPQFVSANTGSNSAAGPVTSGNHETAANAALGSTSDSHTHDRPVEFDEPANVESAASSVAPSHNPFAASTETAPQAAGQADSSRSKGAPSDPAWTVALDRLKALGVTRFHLTNGDAGSRYFFSCSMQTSRNVLQRFEAEASTPAAAAQDVLAQVETWQLTR